MIACDSFLHYHVHISYLYLSPLSLFFTFSYSDNEAQENYNLISNNTEIESTLDWTAHELSQFPQRNRHEAVVEICFFETGKP